MKSFTTIVPVVLAGSLVLPSCTFLFGPKYADDGATDVVVTCVEKADTRPRSYRYRMAVDDPRATGEAVVVGGSVSGEGRTVRWAEYTVLEQRHRLRTNLAEALFDPDGASSEVHYVDVPLGATDRPQSEIYDRHKVESLYRQQGDSLPETAERWTEVANRILPLVAVRWELESDQGELSGEVAPDLATATASGRFTVELGREAIDWALTARQAEYQLTLEIEGDRAVVTLPRQLLEQVPRGD